MLLEFFANLFVLRIQMTTEIKKTANPSVLRQAAQEARVWASQHPRLGAGMLAGMLALGAGGAFAVAIPSTDAVRVQTVTQVVGAGETIAAQQAVLRAAPMVLYRNTQTQAQDTAASLLARLGVNDVGAENWVRTHADVRQQLLGQSDRMVQAEVLPDQRLQKLTVVWLDSDNVYQYHQLDINRATEGGFSHAVQTGKAEVQADLASVPLSDNYFSAAQAAGVPMKLAQKVLDVFDAQVKLDQVASKGDVLDLGFERIMVNGQNMGVGKLLNASVRVQDKDYTAVWFDAAKDGKGKYFAADGRGLEAAYVQPISGGAAITSPFTPFRLHPVFGETRPHTGVDFRAAMGTPLVAVADGEVTFAGVQTGYGNVIKIQHADGYSTLYAHLSSIGVHVGQRVAQNQSIGKSGSTGWSTGPHLHFETRLNDVPQDPVQVMAERRVEGVSVAQRPAFNQVVAEAQRGWGQAHSIQTASAR